MTTLRPETPLKPLAARPPDELLASTSFLLKRLAWAQKDRAMDAFGPTGLSPQHYAVLTLLGEGVREAQGTIADALGYDRSHLVGLLDELEDGGLVERRRDPGDRRRHLVSLTAEGRKTLGKLRAIVKRLEDEFLAPLDEEQRSHLHALLRQLAQHHDPRCAASKPGG